MTDEPAGFEYLHLDDLIELARIVVGDPPPIRDMGLLGAAASRPATTAFGDDAYPDIWTKTAALLQSIVRHHPLIDGNKRLGWVATAVFCDLNDTDLTAASNDDVFDLVMDVAANDPPLDEIASALQRLV